MVRLRDLRFGSSEPEATAASQQRNSPSIRVGDADAGSISELYSGGGSRDPVQTQGPRLSITPSGEVVFPSSDEGGGQFEGAPKKLIHLLTKSHLRRMLRLESLSPAQERNVVLAVTRTQLLC